MKKLALVASRFGSPYPRRSAPAPIIFLPVLSLMILVALTGFVLAAVMRAPASEPPDLLDTIVALYGPACGVLIALVILCERVARLIPNSTTSRVLKVLLVITTVLGVKVPDNQ